MASQCQSFCDTLNAHVENSRSLTFYFNFVITGFYLTALSAFPVKNNIKAGKKRWLFCF
jgi:hypothetical protein